MSHETFAEHKRNNFQWLPAQFGDLSSALTSWALSALDAPLEGASRPPTATTQPKPGLDHFVNIVLTVLLYSLMSGVCQCSKI